MKFGPRKPDMKKSISARTTGKAKRTLKKSIDPSYGKKGMGYIKNPKKAAYNKLYNKTTYSPLRSPYVSSSDSDGIGCLLIAAFVGTPATFGLLHITSGFFQLICLLGLLLCLAIDALLLISGYYFSAEHPVIAFVLFSIISFFWTLVFGLDTFIRFVPLIAIWATYVGGISLRYRQ